MRATLLFFDDGPARATLTLDDWRALAGAHQEFGKSLANAGIAVLDHRVLEPPAVTTTHVFVGGRLVESRPGPYAENRYVLGGFYVVETEHDDALLALLPEAPLPHGTGFVELRPVV